MLLLNDEVIVTTNVKWINNVFLKFTFFVLSKEVLKKIIDEYRNKRRLVKNYD